MPPTYTINELVLYTGDISAVNYCGVSLHCFVFYALAKDEWE